MRLVISISPRKSKSLPPSLFGFSSCEFYPLYYDMFMLICGRVHWTLTLTSSYSKTFVFDRPHEYDKSPLLKIYSLESVFKNLRICGRKRLLRVDGRCKRRKNAVDGALNELDNLMPLHITQTDISDLSQIQKRYS